MTLQVEIKLPPLPRGIHLITSNIVSRLPELPDSGLLHLFVRHTSAAIGLNENADPTVRSDMHTSLENLVPENQPHFEHVLEGPDDMPSHIKVALVGSDITIPVTNGRLNLGTWQGIYFFEFRNRGGSRTVIATIIS